MSEEKDKVTIEIDHDLRIKAEEMYRNHGLTLEDAINVFLRTTVQTGGHIMPMAGGGLGSLFHGFRKKKKENSTIISVSEDGKSVQVVQDNGREKSVSSVDVEAVRGANQ